MGGRERRRGEGRGWGGRGGRRKGEDAEELFIYSCRACRLHQLTIWSFGFGVAMASSSPRGGSSAAGASSSSRASSSPAPKFSLVKPQAQYGVFTDSPEPQIVHSYLYNAETLESKLLGIGVWEVEVDAPSGSSSVRPRSGELVGC